MQVYAQSLTKLKEVLLDGSRAVAQTGTATGSTREQRRALNITHVVDRQLRQNIENLEAYRSSNPRSSLRVFLQPAGTISCITAARLLRA
jgi:hypothetical protein